MTATEETPWILARVVSPSGTSAIERVGPLTPYLTQTIVEDAHAAGRGSTVELEMRPCASAELEESLRRRVELLTGPGVRVAVGRRPRHASDRRVHGAA